MLDFLSEYGILGVFLASFLGATILPLSSEAVVLGVAYAGFSSRDVLLWASLGNCLACALNYLLGFRGGELYLRKKASSKALHVAKQWTKRFGYWAMCFSWLPVVGDPITILAGFFRLKFYVCMPIIFALRIARYVLLLELSRKQGTSPLLF